MKLIVLNDGSGNIYLLLEIKIEFNSSKIELGSGWCRAEGWKIFLEFFYPRFQVTGTIFRLPRPNM